MLDAWTLSHGKPPEAPFALIADGRPADVVAVNAAASVAGLSVGLRLPDARAIMPGLQIAPCDAAAEARLLERLARWAERYAPAVACDHGRGTAQLLIDVTGAAHLHGGEAQLLDDLRRRLDQAGIASRVALADTPGAAWAMARYGPAAVALIEPGRGPEALSPLPIAALRLDQPALDMLRHMRVRTIGDVMALPRGGLARRFESDAEAALVTRLDQALGHRAEPLLAHRPVSAYRADHRCAEPLITGEAVAGLLPSLAEMLTIRLAADGQGARHVVLSTWRVDHAVTEISAGLSSPTRDPEHIVRLLIEAGLERLDLGFGIDALRLSASWTEPLDASQLKLVREAAAPVEEARGRLIDRLRVRLGPRGVRWSKPRASWLPERAERWSTAPAPKATPAALTGPRPILLFDPPERVENATALMPDGAPRVFTWRRVRRNVVKAAGPERVSPEWWRTTGRRSRDYYIVEDDAAQRYWLYREGLFERAEVPDEERPCWYVHGLFG